MPTQYYAVRETESYGDVVLHDDRGCPDGPVRAAPRGATGEECPDCTGDGAGGESETDSEGESTAETVGPEDASEDVEETAAAVEAGVCPWCDEYEGGHVGQHASSAHPDAWEAYRDA